MYKVKRFALTKNEKAGIGLMAGSTGGAMALSKIMDSNLSDNDKLTEKVKDQIHKNGLGIREANLAEIEALKGQKNAFYVANEKNIVDAGLGHKADMLAHELGHHKVQTSKNALVRSTQGPLGNIARFGLNTGGSAVASLLAGRAAGKKAARDEAEGKKEGAISKYGHHAVAIGSGLPIIASEAMASGHGLKILKNAGAAKKDLAKAAGNLAAAGGTYVLGTVGVNEGAAVLGKSLAKRREAKRIKRRKKSD